MSTFPNSPHLHKRATVLLYAESSAVQRVIVLQCNPDMHTRSLQSGWCPEDRTIPDKAQMDNKL